jgi:hypothetical protein
LLKLKLSLMMLMAASPAQLHATEGCPAGTSHRCSKLLLLHLRAAFSLTLKLKLLLHTRSRCRCYR